MKILFVGDVMPGGVLPYQKRYIDEALKEYMEGFDLRIGTLECAIGTHIPPAPEKLKENGGNNNVCFARDEDFFRIKELGFNVMSLGNNHSFDLGESGLKNTIRRLEENGIGYMGAGMNKQEAAKPYVIEQEGGGKFLYYSMLHKWFISKKLDSRHRGFIRCLSAYYR